jgi:phosphoglucosamine mutase
VRGVANRDLTPDLALALGRAAGAVLLPDGGTFVMGRDTRVSGPMLESALIAGLNSAGVDVARLGIIPTPAVALFSANDDIAAGAMVSASHNPVPDNGIKFFTHEGMKIPVGLEEKIEALVTGAPNDLPIGTAVGGLSDVPNVAERYVTHLMKSLHESLSGMKIVLDCAFGSAWEMAPRAFREAGAEVVAINAEPDGSRINVDCGSTSLGALSERVQAERAHMGFAFDGDADRVLACDENGVAIDGDRLIALSALHMHAEGRLKNDIVVATVMANLGFTRALEERGIEVLQTPVGDKYVAEAMQERGAVLGGEQSGHIIFSEFALTGDGILAGLQVAAIAHQTKEPLSRLAGCFERVPQVLINVPVTRRVDLESSEDLWSEVAEAEKKLGSDGRILLRPSGTEQLVRVMVEAVDPDVARSTAQRLAERVQTLLGSA